MMCEVEKIKKRHPDSTYEIAVWINGSKHGIKCYKKELTPEGWRKKMEDMRLQTIKRHGFDGFEMHESVCLSEYMPDGFEMKVEV